MLVFKEKQRNSWHGQNMLIHGGKSLHRYYDLYQRLRLQFFVLLMMGTMDAQNM